jgi:cell fate (sporulation/competence/biofilm development) regulator YmcA (YheA/YmcA/DUF963 family)
MDFQQGLPFSLFDIETVINHRNYDQADIYIKALLDFCEKAPRIDRAYQEPENAENNTVSMMGFYPFTNRLSFLQQSEYCTRLASALTCLFVDPGYKISHEMYIYYLLYKCHLTAFFGASSFGNMDHILIQKGLADSQLQLNLKTEDDIKQFMLFYTLTSQISIEPELFFDAVPDYAGHFYLALLYNVTSIKKSQGQVNLTKLVTCMSVIERIPAHPTLLEISLNVWMDITYIDNPNKHTLKGRLNEYIRRCHSLFLNKNTFSRIEKHAKKRKKTKKIMVFMERYLSTHAMYRCYDRRIDQLKEEFDVVLLTEEGQLDQHNQNGFLKIHTVSKDLKHLDSMVNIILDENPDVIWYPSIGMATWGPVLANLRLSPQQVISMGHPASSCTKTIDHALTLGAPANSDYQQYFSEKVSDVTIQDKEYKKSSLFPKSIPTKTIHDGVIRISINSSEFKITPYFLKFCQLIDKMSSKTIEFNFFKYKQNGAYALSFEREIRSLLSHVKYHNHSAYPEYLQQLAECDLALGTFPFGGTNTNVDLVTLGIPKIIIARGGDIHEISDQIFFQDIGAPDEIFTGNETEFVERVLSLIENDNARLDLSIKLKAIKVFEIFRLSDESGDRIKSYFNELMN